MMATTSIENEPAGTPAKHSAFVPLCLLGLALLGWMGFQTLQLSKEREQLGEQAAALATPMDNAAKLRAQGDALVKATRALAQQGNPNAQAMVAELQRRGITIKPDAK